MFARRLSALMAALNIVTASSLPLWQDSVRQTEGPPAHRGYRLFVHKEEAGGGGRGFKKQRSGLMPGPTSPTLSYWCFIPGMYMLMCANALMVGVAFTWP